MKIFLAILFTLAAGTGAFLRLKSGLLLKPHFPAFFAGTLLVNVAGSFVLGWAYFTWKNEPATTMWMLIIGTAFCGSLTTFSTFSVEILRLLDDSRFSAAVLYSLLSVFLGVGAAWAGKLTAGA